jgi:hypothetical protein
MVTDRCQHDRLINAIDKQRDRTYSSYGHWQMAAQSFGCLLQTDKWTDLTHGNNPCEWSSPVGQTTNVVKLLGFGYPSAIPRKAKPWTLKDQRENHREALGTNPGCGSPGEVRTLEVQAQVA